jgi:hypothetical protein
MDSREIVQEGHRALAQRVMPRLDLMLSEIPKQPPAIQAVLDGGKSALSEISRSGDYARLDAAQKKHLSDIVPLVESSIGLKPHDPDIMFGLAVSAIRAYFNIESMEEFARRSGITQFAYGGSSGVAYTSTNGKAEKIFMFSFSPRQPALSTIVTIHELYSAMQPEMPRILGILERANEVPGYSEFMLAVRNDPELKQRWLDAAVESHQLAFFSTELAQHAAAERGADIAAFKEYLRENTPMLNLLSCYVAGDAYLMQGDIIVKAPDLVSHPEAGRYELLSLADAARGPLLPPKMTVYDVGIGLASYIRGNPGSRDEILSHAFAENLTREFF